MKIEQTPLRQIAELIDASVIGNPNFPVTGLNEIHKVEMGDITFVDHPKYYAKALNSAASVVLINKEVECPEGKALLLHDDPFDAFIRIMRHFRPFEPQNQPISPSAQIGEGTLIMPGAFVGHHTVIGKNCIIHPNVTIENEVLIGRNCEIKSGVVIGQDGFGFERYEDGTPIHFPHYGKVIVKDNVFIGANACIDRGAMGDTVVEDDVKIANLVHIAHNCHIGNGSFIIGSSVLCGGAQVGNNCWIAPNVSVKEHIKINDNALIGLGSVVLNDIEQDTVMVGNPARKL